MESDWTKAGADIKTKSYGDDEISKMWRWVSGTADGDGSFPSYDQGSRTLVTSQYISEFQKTILMVLTMRMRMGISLILKGWCVLKQLIMLTRQFYLRSFLIRFITWRKGTHLRWWQRCLTGAFIRIPQILSLPIFACPGGSLQIHFWLLQSTTWKFWPRSGPRQSQAEEKRANKDDFY